MLIERFEGLSIKGHLMAKIKLEICTLLQKIYEIYFGRTVLGVWAVYSDLIHNWIMRNKMQNTLFTKENIPEFHHSILESNLQVQNRRFQTTPSRISPEMLEKEELVMMKKYGPIQESQIEEAEKCIGELARRYLGGELSEKALGNLEELEKDSIIYVLMDMILNKQKKLCVEGMNLTHMHFNQLHYVLRKIKNMLILNNEEDLETYEHMVQLHHSFQLLVGSEMLPKDQLVLKQIIQIFKLPHGNLTSLPGLTELCYTCLWGHKCQICNRWYRSTAPQLKQRTPQNELLFRLLSNTCSQYHQVSGNNTKAKYTCLDIVPKNQELLRNIKVHISILQFLQRKYQDRYLNSELQTQVFLKCLDFIYYFIKNNELNASSITKTKYIQMLCRFALNPIFTKKVLRILIEQIRNNLSANRMITQEIINYIIKEASKRECTLFCEYIKFLKILTQSNNKILKERQRQIIRGIHKYFPIEYLILSGSEGAKYDEELPDVLLGLHKIVVNNIREPNYLRKDFLGFPDEEQKTSNCLLYKHLEFVNLLAACAKEENMITVTFCGKYISIEVLKYIYILCYI